MRNTYEELLNHRSDLADEIKKNQTRLNGPVKGGQPVRDAIRAEIELSRALIAEIDSEIARRFPHKVISL